MKWHLLTHNDVGKLPHAEVTQSIPVHVDETYSGNFICFKQ